MPSDFTATYLQTMIGWLDQWPTGCTNNRQQDVIWYQLVSFHTERYDHATKWYDWCHHCYNLMNCSLSSDRLTVHMRLKLSQVHIALFLLQIAHSNSKIPALSSHSVCLSVKKYCYSVPCFHLFQIHFNGAVWWYSILVNQQFVSCCIHEDAWSEGHLFCQI